MVLFALFTVQIRSSEMKALWFAEKSKPEIIFIRAVVVVVVCCFGVLSVICIHIMGEGEKNLLLFFVGPAEPSPNLHLKRQAHGHGVVLVK